MVDLFIHDVEVKAKKINLREYLLNISSGQISSYSINFKNYLKELLVTLNQNGNEFNSLKSLNEKELKKSNLKIKKYNRFFDKLNDLYHSSKYFADAELKEIFRAISRQLHKIENLSFNYLQKNNVADSTLFAIKAGLSKFPSENNAQKLNPNN